MLMIRFQRIGRKNDAAFRMAVLPKTAGPKAGSYIDLVGTYNPKTKAMTVNAESIKSWIAKGAQVSPSLMNLLITKGILEGKKTAVIAKSTLEKNVAKRAAEEEAKKAAEVAASEKAAADAKAAEVAAASVEEAPVAEETVEVSSEEAAPVVAEAEEVPAEEVAA